MSRRCRASLTEIALACAFSGSSDFTVISRALRRAAARVRRRGLSQDRPRSNARVARARAHCRAARIPTASPCRFGASRRGAWRSCASSSRTRAGVPATAARLARVGEGARARRPDASGSANSGRIRRIVALELCRYDIGLEVPDGTIVDGDVNAIAFRRWRSRRSRSRGRSSWRCKGDQIGCTGRGCRRAATSPIISPAFEAWNGEPFAHEHGALRLCASSSRSCVLHSFRAPSSRFASRSRWRSSARPTTTSGCASSPLPRACSTAWRRGRHRSRSSRSAPSLPPATLVLRRLPRASASAVGVARVHPGSASRSTCSSPPR